MKKVLSLMLILAMLLTMASFPAFAAEISLSEANVIASPYTAMGSVAELFDGDEATGHLPSGLAYIGSPTAMTSNNEYVFDLGASYDNPELTLVWGSHGHGQWGYTAPDGYAVYYSADNSVYEPAAEYTDLHANTTAGTLPAGLTASRTYLEEYVLTGITTVNATGVKYIKIVVTSYAYGGPMLKEVSVVGTPATSGGETPDEPTTPPAEPAKINVASVTTSFGDDGSKIIDGENSREISNWQAYKSSEVVPLGDGTTELYNFVFDLGSKYEVTEIFSRWCEGTMEAAVIYGTDDLNGEWTTIQAIAPSYESESECWTNFGSATVDCGGTGYQYYKLSVTKSKGAWDASVGDMVASTLTCYEIEFTGIPYVEGDDEVDITDAVTLLGSSIRLEKDGLSAGLRFGAKVDKAALGIEDDWAYAEDAEYEFGMYMLPEEMLGENDNLEAYLNNGGKEALKIIAKNVWEQTDATIEYTAVLTKIPEGAWNQSIVAVPYVTDGTETVYYNEQTDSYISVAWKAIDLYNNGNPYEISPEDFATLKEIVGDTSVEPAVITGITVTGENLTAWEDHIWHDDETGIDWPIDHSFSLISDGMGGTGTPAPNWDARFISDEDVSTLESFSLIFDMGGKRYDVSKIYFVWAWSYGISNADIYGSNDGGATWTLIKSTSISINSWGATSMGVPDSIVELDCGGVGYSMFKIESNSVSALGDPAESLEIFEIEFTGIPTEDAGEQPAPSLMYYNVDSANGAATLNGSNSDASTLFVLPAGYDGFEINGNYKVDAETLRMLTTVPCTGNGTIAYKDYREFASYIATVDSSWGQYDDQGYGVDNYGDQIKSAPVSKLSDPVYMSMVLASEAPTYMDKNNKPQEHQNNGNNMHAPSEDTVFNRINALGAIYVNKALKNELKANYKDEQVTVCIGNIKLLVRTAEGWIEKTVAVPTAGFGMLYALPWQLEWELGSDAYAKQLCINVDNNITQYANYSAIKMDVADFLENKRGNWWGGTSFDERVFHFWGNIHTLSELGISKDTEVLGVIASYEIWVEEEELAPYFVASVGADWRLESGATRQAFAGHQIITTTDKQVLFGHNFGAEDYETYVAGDLDYIKARLGIN